MLDIYIYIYIYIYVYIYIYILKYDYVFIKNRIQFKSLMIIYSTNRLHASQLQK